MAWNDYARLTRNQRANLAQKAAKGNELARSEFLRYSRQIKKEANLRLASLEKAGLDYGSTYNNLAYYLQVENNSNRLLSPAALKFDIWEIHTQNEVALRFLNNKSSIVRNARAAERARISTLKSHEVLPKTFKRKENVEFLRFLGNEAVTATIENYARSDVVVAALYDTYKEQGNKVFKIAEKALTEFLSGRITFDVAMERTGIKIEDYYSKRPTS